MPLQSAPHLCPASMLWSTVRRGDSYWLILVAMPWLLLLFRPNWIYYSVNGTIDPWVYYGYYRHLQPFLRDFFAGTYYGSRLSVILPGYVCYALLPPHAANLVLHLGWYYVSIFSLYYTLRHLAGRQTALLSCLLFGTYPGVLLSLGWDYVDGPGNAMFLLAIALVTLTAPRRRCWLVLGVAGAVVGMLVVSNIVWIALAPVVPAYFLFLHRDRLRQRPVFMVVSSSVILLGGFCLTFAILGTINFYLAHDFWFFAPTLRFVQSQAGQKNPYNAEGWSWLIRAMWLILPGWTVLAAIMALGTGWRRSSASCLSARFWGAMFLFSALVFILLQLSGQPFLYLPYYASYLTPVAFLALGVIGLGRLTLAPRLWWPLLGVVLCGCFVLNADFMRQTSLYAIPLYASLAVGALLMLPRALWPDHPWPRLILIAGILFVDMLVTLIPMFPGPDYDGAAFYSRVFDVDRRTFRATQGNLPRFWYDATEKSATQYASIASVYLYQYNLVNGAFPSTADGRLKAGQFIAILSETGDSAGRAARAVRPLGLDVAPLLHHRVEHAPYWLDVLQLRQTLPLGPSFDIQFRDGVGYLQRHPGPDSNAGSILPQAYWLKGSASRFLLKADGWHTKPLPLPWAYVATYPPIAAPEPGNYIVAATIQLGHGAVRLLVEDGKTHEVLGVSGPPQLTPGAQTLVVPLHLAPGQTFRVVLTNLNTPASRLVIQQLKVYSRITPPAAICRPMGHSGHDLFPRRRSPYPSGRITKRMNR